MPLRAPASPQRPRTGAPPLRTLAGTAAAALAIALGAVACGGGGSDEDEVRDTLERFEQATKDRRYAEICDGLLSERLIDRVRGAGVRCAAAVRVGLGGVVQPTLDVEKVEIDGDEARATVTSFAQGEQESTDTVRLVKEDGDWKIDSLGGGG